MIWTRAGGSERGPLVVMLHGLGATADVWLGVEELLPECWAGGWLSVDLPGHGRSARGASYDFQAHADALRTVVPDDRDVVLLGHSMGGMVALAMAPQLPRTTRVIGFSIKTWWPPTHVAGMKKQAARQPQTLTSRSETLSLYARMAGLRGLVPAESPSLHSGIVEVSDGWQLAQDPATFDFGVPDMAALLPAAGCPVTLARGSEDHLVRPENIDGLVPDPVTLERLGHNPHVEDPAAIVALLVG